MRKKGNILIHALFTIGLSSVILIGISKAATRLYNIQSIVSFRDPEIVIVDVTLDKFHEDVDSQLTFYSDNELTYTAEEFHTWVIDWFENSTQCTAGTNANADDINWDQLYRTGKLDEGIHVYTATCDTATQEFDYVINIEYIVQADYIGPGGYQNNQVLCYEHLRQANCDIIQNEDNWEIIYVLDIVESYYQ